MSVVLAYWAGVAIWFALALARGAYVAGRSAGKYGDSDGPTDLAWYAFNWGVMGGILWPLTLPFALGYKLGQERGS